MIPFYHILRQNRLYISIFRIFFNNSRFLNHQAFIDINTHAYMSQPSNSPQFSVSESLPEKVNLTDLCTRGLKQIIVCCTPHFKKVQSCIINWKIIMFCMSLLLRLLELHGCLLGFIHTCVARLLGPYVC